MNTTLPSLIDSEVVIEITNSATCMISQIDYTNTNHRIDYKKILFGSPEFATTIYTVLYEDF